ncbi:MAG: caspase domain-containing protein [Kiloniellales bacterium]
MAARRFAVLIGNSEFPADAKLTDLNGPENDVEALSEVLASPEFGDFAEVEVLKNKPHYEALRQINRALKKAERDDLVLIYYSGHGKLDGAGRLHLAACDTETDELEATSIPVQSIRNFIDVSRSTKTALILDCCYSGAVGKAFFRGGVDDQLNQAAGGRGTYIVTASTAIQLAKEKEEDRHGIFTKHLIEGIRGGAADRDGDGYVTMNEIYSYVHDHVLAESHQEPMKWDLNVRGELIVSKSGTGPWEEQRAQIRARMLQLAHEGSLPDSILTPALRILAMKRPEMDAQAQAYGALLEGVLRDDFRLGGFIDDWFRLAAAPPPEPEPVHEPPRQERVKPEPPREPPFWAKAVPRAQRKARPPEQPPREEPSREAPPQERPQYDDAASTAQAAASTDSGPAAEQKGGIAQNQTAQALLYWFLIVVAMAVVAGVASESYDGESIFATAALVALVGSAVRGYRRRQRLNLPAVVIYWFGCTMLAAIAATFAAQEAEAFPITLIAVGAVSGAHLIKWWRGRSGTAKPKRSFLGSLLGGR